MADILAVGASPRKGGNTDVLIKHAAKGARKIGLEVEIIQLRDYTILPCIGCERCRKNSVCTGCLDGMQLLYPQIEKSRGFILASPTHNYNITAWMKAFIDRLYAYYIFTDDRPRRYSSRFKGQERKAAAIAVCEQPDPKDMGFTMEAMTMPLNALGYEMTGELPVYNIFDRGAVKEYSDILSSAEALGEKLGRALAGRE